MKRHPRIRSLPRQLGYLGPGAKRILGGLVGDAAYRRFVASPAFDAPLLTSVGLVRGIGSATFTRATAATFTDWEGVVRTALSGEVRFQGARRVQNFVNSENVSGWGVVGTASVDNGAVAGVGPNGETVREINLDAGAFLNIATPIGMTFPCDVRLSFYVRALTGTVTVSTRNMALGGVENLVIGTTWTRVTSLRTAVGSVGTCGIQANVDTGLLQCTGFQVEDVTGQSNQAPAELVSRGVLSSPYHGAMVDGVKYFATENGNTVASNVVTEATGAAISASTLLGYLSEQASTNLVVRSAELDNAAWAASNVTVAVNQYVAADGTTTLDKITANAGNALHYIQQNGPIATAVPYTLTVDLRYVNNQWAVLGVYDGVTSFWGTFDIQSGVVGSVAAGTTSRIVAGPNGLYRCSITFTPAAVTIYPQIAPTNATGSSPFTSWNAAGTEAIGAGFVQLEALSFATSYIPTTTVAVTRNADVLTYPTSGNVSGTAGTAYAEMTCQSFANRYAIEANAAGNEPLLYFSSATSKLSIYDSTTESLDLAFTPSLTTPAQIASVWGGSSMKTASEGTLGSGAAFDGAINVGTNLRIGIAGAGVGSVASLNGTIRNVKLWTSAASDAVMTRLTA